MRPTTTHVIILIIVVLLLFGANRLPGLARSVGQSLKIFKKEVSDLTDSGKDTPAAPSTSSTAPDPVPGTDPGDGIDVPPPPPAPPAPPAPPRS